MTSGCHTGECSSRVSWAMGRLHDVLSHILKNQFVFLWLFSATAHTALMRQEQNKMKRKDEEVLSPVSPVPRDVRASTSDHPVEDLLSLMPPSQHCGRGGGEATTEQVGPSGGSLVPFISGSQNLYSSCSLVFPIMVGRRMYITGNISAGRGLRGPLHSLLMFIAEDHEIENVKNF